MGISLRPGGILPSTEALFIAALLPLAGTAEAQEPPRPLVVQAENVTVLDDPDRDGEGASAPMLPGDVVEFTLTFTNTTNDSIRRVEFTDAIPAGLVIQVGSASASRTDVEIDYSIDGGGSWSLAPVVEEETADGGTVTRPAAPHQYTNIRWRVAGWIQPGRRVSAQFRAQLPARIDGENGGFK